MPKMLEKPEWLRANVTGKAIGVDRENNTINGVILAEEGPFKSEGRGEFDRKAIRSIVKMANEKPGGLKSRWTHPGLSSDGLGKFLGRYKDVRSDTVLRDAGQDENGKQLMKEVLVARGNLKLDPTALEPSPESGGKSYGQYIMDLAESDPDAFGTSLVLQVNQEYRLDKQGKPLKDAKGDDLPPLWIPTVLHANDIVDEGDATNSFLSADILAGLPDAIVRQGCELLDAQFAGQTREVVEARCSAFLNRYLAYHFGDDEESLCKGGKSGERCSGNPEPAAEADKQPPAAPSEPADADLATMLDLCIAEAG
jgi:hypothetical protein